MSLGLKDSFQAKHKSAFRFSLFNFIFRQELWLPRFMLYRTKENCHLYNVNTISFLFSFSVFYNYAHIYKPRYEHRYTHMSAVWPTIILFHNLNVWLYFSHIEFSYLLPGLTNTSLCFWHVYFWLIGNWEKWARFALCVCSLVRLWLLKLSQ